MGLAEANTHLTALRRRIERGQWESVSDLWGGAGVIIRTAPQPPDKEDQFYPSPRCIVTQCAKELTWVFGELASVMRLAECTDRELFFGDVADAIFYFLGEKNGTELKPLLLAAIKGDRKSVV